MLHIGGHAIIINMFYEVRAQYGTYRSVVPFVETSRGGTIVFQTSQIHISQEVKEHLKIVGMFHHLAHYNKKMEQMMIELLVFKL
jgi:hypothetical protein